jgi:NADH dehydrogenase/NADH:ubiquinone oxidoreductase subunit G
MKLKYMGTADVKELLKGDTFSDVLSEGLPVHVEFNRKNGWTIDTDAEPFSEISDEVWEHLILNDSFMDVTDYVRTPLNDHQKTFMGLREGQQKTLAEEEEARQAALDAAFESARAGAAQANAREEILAKIRSSDATRAELLEYAKEKNIKGRTKMNQEELQEALVDLVQNEQPATSEVSPSSPAHTGSAVSGAGTTTGGSTGGGGGTVGGSTRTS